MGFLVGGAHAVDLAHEQLADRLVAQGGDQRNRLIEAEVALRRTTAQVSGPTGAMTVVLVPIVHQHGASGVLAVGLLAGIVLVALAIAGVGRAVRYMPAPVIEGFTAGIAAVIALQQVPAALGIALNASSSNTVDIWVCKAV